MSTKINALQMKSKWGNRNISVAFKSLQYINRPFLRFETVHNSLQID